uniref:Uncharacterized protein n=1 Tax=Palpitomonas bilix TaxID=652834 RepID=A0A7S3G7R2_9EUKA|mmetsp:Transcript_28562/g.72772  ORF Transcript_28562/g.72772 Transcript_28562/m.72772 type:complete len:719 (+) Transcript_28562:114-2270(+)
MAARPKGETYVHFYGESESPPPDEGGDKEEGTSFILGIDTGSSDEGSSSDESSPPPPLPRGGSGSNAPLVRTPHASSDRGEEERGERERLSDAVKEKYGGVDESGVHARHGGTAQQRGKRPPRPGTIRIDGSMKAGMPLAGVAALFCINSLLSRMSFNGPFWFEYLEENKNFTKEMLTSQMTPFVAYGMLALRPIAALLPELLSSDPNTPVSKFRLPYAVVVMLSSLFFLSCSIIEAFGQPGDFALFQLDMLFDGFGTATGLLYSLVFRVVRKKERFMSVMSAMQTVTLVGKVASGAIANSLRDIFGLTLQQIWYINVGMNGLTLVSAILLLFPTYLFETKKAEVLRSWAATMTVHARKAKRMTFTGASVNREEGEYKVQSKERKDEVEVPERSKRQELADVFKEFFYYFRFTSFVQLFILIVVGESIAWVVSLNWQGVLGKAGGPYNGYVMSGSTGLAAAITMTIGAVNSAKKKKKQREKERREKEGEEGKNKDEVKPKKAKKGCCTPSSSLSPLNINQVWCALSMVLFAVGVAGMGVVGMLKDELNTNVTLKAFSSNGDVGASDGIPLWIVLVYVAYAIFLVGKALITLFLTVRSGEIIASASGLYMEEKILPAARMTAKLVASPKEVRKTAQKAGNGRYALTNGVTLSFSSLVQALLQSTLSARDPHTGGLLVDLNTQLIVQAAILVFVTFITLALTPFGDRLDKCCRRRKGART